MRVLLCYMCTSCFVLLLRYVVFCRRRLRCRRPPPSHGFADPPVHFVAKRKLNEDHVVTLPCLKEDTDLRTADWVITYRPCVFRTMMFCHLLTSSSSIVYKDWEIQSYESVQPANITFFVGFVSVDVNCVCHFKKNI